MRQSVRQGQHSRRECPRRQVSSWYCKVRRCGDMSALLPECCSSRGSTVISINRLQRINFEKQRPMSSTGCRSTRAPQALHILRLPWTLCFDCGDSGFALLHKHLVVVGARFPSASLILCPGSYSPVATPRRVCGCVGVWVCGCVGVLVVWLFGCLVVWLFGCLFVCLFGWLVGWLVGCLVVWLFGCLVVWLFGCLVVWLFGCLVVWLCGRLVDWSIGRLVDWSIGRLVDWSIGRLVVWSFGRLVVWSFGRLVVWSFGRLVVWSFVCLT